jgi:ubiquinone/menaquinone biosynthesis C-methylase UbiE
VPFETRQEKEIARINRTQREWFDRTVQLFEPPLPKGVPERLARIVAAAGIRSGDSVLDVGSGTGILIPEIRTYRPATIYACDLSERMLAQLRRNHAGVETVLSDVRDMTMPDESIDVVLINACYPNIADKPGAFTNLSRMMKPAGRLVVSHPLGRGFLAVLRKNTPYPLDDFPTAYEAKRLLDPYGFTVRSCVDEPELYILTTVKRG